jgi:hypothetical protein
MHITSEGSVFTYRLQWADGSDAGEATYGFYVRVGDEVLISDGGEIRRLRVLDALPVPQGSPYDGLLRVEQLR